MTEKKKLAGYLVLTAGLVLLILYSRQIFQMLGNLWGIIMPLVSGGVLAYILNLITTRLESMFFPSSKRPWINKIRPFACILLAVLLIIVVLFFIINLVLPELANAIAIFSTNIPVYLSQLIDQIDEIIKNPLILDNIERLLSDQVNIQEQIVKFATRGISGLVSSASAVVGGVGSAVFNFFIAFSFAIYLLAGKKTLARQVGRVAQAFLPQLWRERIGVVLTIANETFSSFIVGQVTEAVILGSLCILGMWILKIPYATAVGVFVGATALIPIVGAWVGAGIGALLIMAVNFWKAILFIIFIVILQQTENNLIYPRVVGTSIGLPGIWVLAAITIGGGVGGIAGMLISVPLTATGYKLLRLAVSERLADDQDS